MTEARERTWESRRPPVLGYFIGMSAWLAWACVCLGFVPRDWYPAWFPGASMLAGWLWWALAIHAGFQTIRVAFWARARAGCVMACVVFLCLLALQVALYYSFL